MYHWAWRWSSQFGLEELSPWTGLRTEWQHVVQTCPSISNLAKRWDLSESQAQARHAGSHDSGLIEPGRGSVYVDSTDVAHASGGELRRLRRQMQPVFQDPYAASIRA